MGLQGEARSHRIIENVPHDSVEVVVPSDDAIEVSGLPQAAMEPRCEEVRGPLAPVSHKRSKIRFRALSRRDDVNVVWHDAVRQHIESAPFPGPLERFNQDWRNIR